MLTFTASTLRRNGAHTKNEIITESPAFMLITGKTLEGSLIFTLTDQINALPGTPNWQFQSTEMHALVVLIAVTVTAGRSLNTIQTILEETLVYNSQTVRTTIVQNTIELKKKETREHILSTCLSVERPISHQRIICHIWEIKQSLSKVLVQSRHLSLG